MSHAFFSVQIVAKINFIAEPKDKNTLLLEQGIISYAFR